MNKFVQMVGFFGILIVLAVMYSVLFDIVLKPFFDLEAKTLSCPKTKIINLTKEKFNKFDRETLERAKLRCVRIYEDNPCVIAFYKRPNRDYYVVCGEKR